MILRYNNAGFMIVLPGDDPHETVDAILETEYDGEFCVSPSFDPDFIAGLMEAGFLVMSTMFGERGETGDGAFYVALPKLHLVRSVLFFDDLHVKKSARRFLGRYELRHDSDFDFILNRCIEVHGDDWLTPPLVDAIAEIRRRELRGVRPTSFALYRDGRPVSGEFGVSVGGVYTSYSGYYDETGAGTVQLILATRWLRDNGFAFFDLGMPLDYKSDLGAVDLSPRQFVGIFRSAQNTRKNGEFAHILDTGAKLA